MDDPKCEVEQEILHHLWEVIAWFGDGLRVVLLMLARVLISPKGDLLENFMLLNFIHVKMIKYDLVTCICNGL